LPDSSIEQRLAVLTDSHEQGRLAVTDGVALRYCRWMPVNPRGRVLLLSGRGGFLEKYYSTVIRLLERGLEVVSFDWRGQGLSSRLLADCQRGHVDDFVDYIADLDRIWTELFQSPADTDNYLLAHSMGAHVALRWLREKQAGRAAFRHAWLTAPLFGIDTRPYPLAVAKALAAMVCVVGGHQRYVFGGGPYRPETYRKEGLANLSSDSQQMEYELACLQQDPALQLGSPTFGWLRAGFRSMSCLHSRGYVEQIEQPITQFVAGDELVVNNAACADVQRRLPHGELLTIPDAKHDLLIEKGALQAPLWNKIDRQLSADFDAD